MAMGRLFSYAGRVSVRTIVAALMVLAITPMAIVNLWLMGQAREEAITHRKEVLQNVVSFASAQYEIFIQTINSALDVDPARLAVVISDPEACSHFLRNSIVQHPFLQASIVLSRSGIVLCETGQGLRNRDLSNRNYFQEALRQDGLVIDEPVLAQATGRPVLPVARRVSGLVPDAGASDEAAVVAAAFDVLAFLQSIHHLASETQYYRDGNINVWLVNRNGMIINDVRDPTKQGAILPFLATRTDILPFEIVADTTEGGEYVFMGGRVLPGFVQVVVAARLADIISRPQRRLLISVLTAAMAVICGLGLSYILLGRLIIRPLAMLKHMATDIQNGYYNIRYHTAKIYTSELKSLETAFRRMADVVLQREIFMKQRHDALSDLANRDPLTNIANRRTLENFLKTYWSESMTTGQPLSILFVDVDFFKSYNDTYGHRAGDNVLIRVAQTLTNLPLRPDDLVARYGGEEFVIVLPHTGLSGARAVAERAREAIEALRIEHRNSPWGVVTVSIGVASNEEHAPSSFEELLTRADAVLYSAKQAGRNRVALDDGSAALADRYHTEVTYQEAQPRGHAR